MAVYGSAVYGTSTYGASSGLDLADATATATATAYAEGVGFVGSTFDLEDATAAATATAFLESIYVSPAQIEALTIPLVVPTTITVSVVPEPVTPPTGVHAVTREAHLMPPLTEANPSSKRDYPIDRGTVGVRHAWVGGVDITYTLGKRTAIEYTLIDGMGPATATLTLPIQPWQKLGEGALWFVTKDAPVEIGLVPDEGATRYVWDGYYTGVSHRTGQTATIECEGTLAQAGHDLHQPPVWMDDTDRGRVVADVLNATPHRRFRPVKRFTTGLKTRDRGDQSKTRMEHAQDIMAVALTDDGKQLTIRRRAPFDYQLAWRTLTLAADFTYTYDAHGVVADLKEDENARRDAVWGRGVAPDGGVWGGWDFPGLDSYLIPDFPMAGFPSMVVGTTDAGTTTGQGVSDWQRRMRILGYPVKVDGVMNANDTQWVLKIQRDAGITVDGYLGPQTWAATFDPGTHALDLTAVRRPLAVKPGAEPYRYSASGAIIGDNPNDDPSMVIRGTPEVNFGTMEKRDAEPLAERMLARDAEAGVVGTLTLGTDPHEAGTSRLDIEPGHVVALDGYCGETVLLYVVEATHGDVRSVLRVDSKARDPLSVDTIIERDERRRRELAARPSRTNDRSSLAVSAVNLYQGDATRAGWFPRVAVNGNSGLWTVLPIIVGTSGVTRIEFETESPKAELVIAVWSRPVTANLIASFVPDPLSSSDGWYDHIDTLKSKHGLLEIYGSPESPGGYWPRQKGSGPLTGDLVDGSGAPLLSEYGGYLWISAFTSTSCYVSGRAFPGVIFP